MSNTSGVMLLLVASWINESDIARVETLIETKLPDTYKLPLIVASPDTFNVITFAVPVTVTLFANVDVVAPVELNDVALTCAPNVPYELALIKPVTVVLPSATTPDTFNAAALTVPPNVPYVLTLTKPVIVVLPAAVSPEMFNEAAFTAPANRP